MEINTITHQYWWEDGVYYRMALSGGNRHWNGRTQRWNGQEWIV